MFYSFAKELWPGCHHPTVTHRFIAMLEQHGKLLRNYTQNIDVSFRASHPPPPPSTPAPSAPNADPRVLTLELVFPLLTLGHRDARRDHETSAVPRELRHGEVHDVQESRAWDGDPCGYHGADDWSVVHFSCGLLLAALSWVC
jgi:hypothetical protein